MKGKWGLKGIQLQESSRIVLSTTWTGREGCNGTLQSCLSFLVPPELSIWRVVPSFCLSISAEGRNSCSLFEKVLWDLGGLQGQDQEPWSTVQTVQWLKGAPFVGIEFGPASPAWPELVSIPVALHCSPLSWRSPRAPHLKVIAMWNHRDHLGLKLRQNKQASSHSGARGSSVCRSEQLCRNYLGSCGTY